MKLASEPESMKAGTEVRVELTPSWAGVSGWSAGGEDRERLSRDLLNRAEPGLLVDRRLLCDRACHSISTGSA